MAEQLHDRLEYVDALTGALEGDLRADGSVPMTGNLDLGDNSIVNAGDVSTETLTLNGVLVGVNPVSGNNVARTYATVAAMIAATDLVVGQTAITQGYTFPGDNFGAQYRIVAAGTGTADGTSFIDLDTLQAELLPANDDQDVRKNKVISQFGSGRRDLGLYGMFYNSTVDTEPWLLTHIGAGQYLRCILREEGGAGYAVRTLGEMHILQLYQSAGPDTDSTNVPITNSVTGWTTGVASTPAFDGQYAYNSTAGEYYEWTTPDNTTMVGQRGNHLADGGIGVVTINGDATLATNLPTAQDLVDAGTIAALGTLNATDRCINYNELDAYDYEGMSGNADVAVMFTNELPPGAHTVRVTVSAEKATVSTGNRVYYSGVIYRTLDTKLSSPNVWGMGSNDFNGISNQHGGGLIFLGRVSPTTNSVTEFAFHLLPTGATDDVTWIGNGHGYEEQVDLKFYVDGAERTLTELTCYPGDEVVAVRTSELFHPDIGAGATAIANVTVEYRINESGLLYTVEIDWLSAGTGEGGYIHMLPVDNSFNVGNSVIVNSTDVSLDADDGSFVLNAKTDLLYLWQSTGAYATALHVLDLNAANENFRYCGSNFFELQDRNLGEMNKVYVSRGDESVPIALGDKWLSSAQIYVAVKHPDAARHFAQPIKL